MKQFPEDAQDLIGFALYRAQIGKKHGDANPLSGFGSGVFEIACRSASGSYRLAYTVRFEHAIYALHAFQKKSKQGISTPKFELELIRKRLRAAEAEAVSGR